MRNRNREACEYMAELERFYLRGIQVRNRTQEASSYVIVLEMHLSAKLYLTSLRTRNSSFWEAF